MNDPRRHAPATLRNRNAILDVLQRVLPPTGLVLELNSGTGEHAAFMAPRLAPRQWQPSDIDSAALASIAAHTAETDAPNLLPPVEIDVTTQDWPIEEAAAVVSANMIHIAPWKACLGLLDGAARILPEGDGILYLYGPFKRNRMHTAPSNEAFDQSLRSQDPRWGVRDLEDVIAEAENRGFHLAETVEMPSNNLSVIFRKHATA
ncbi:MAG: DUF938 domain-containing protein [Alphaproteobacteria bacterium]|nr:DUF938 domain-containing protein [Alphaproteobacteria bacterium]